MLKIENFECEKCQIFDIFDFRKWQKCPFWHFWRQKNLINFSKIFLKLSYFLISKNSENSKTHKILCLDWIFIFAKYYLWLKILLKIQLQVWYAGPYKKVISQNLSFDNNWTDPHKSNLAVSGKKLKHYGNSCNS